MEREREAFVVLILMREEEIRRKVVFSVFHRLCSKAIRRMEDKYSRRFVIRGSDGGRNARLTDCE